MRSSAIRLPSGPTTAIDTGTPISSAFSIAALMNSRHSTARNFAMSDSCSHSRSITKAGGGDDAVPLFCFVGDKRAELFRRSALDIEPGGVQRLCYLVIPKRFVDRASEFFDDLVR